ncbi:MAG: trigger factor [Acidobacteria bacterium]|nr:trigger factor [Acidobacteriota bacterium]
MTEATCRRELELEVPADEVEKASVKLAKDFSRVARIPGFRPGKAPTALIRRRFAEDIKAELLQSLVPNYFEKAVTEQKMVPVTQPHLENAEFVVQGPLKFKVSFEILPTFELNAYKDLEVEVNAVELTEADTDKTLETMRDRAATFVPVEGRSIQDGDYVQVKLKGIPMGGGGETIDAEDVMCHIGGEETLAAFNENLKGANPGEQKRFDVKYPADYPDPKLTGKEYTYLVDVRSIKERKLPELNDEFAKDVSDVATLAELRGKIRESLEAARDQKQTELAKQALLEKIVAAHEFPVPEAMVEGQLDARLERTVRSLASQGVDPRAVNVDWVALRDRQRDRATADVKAELLLDRIATAENIEVAEEDVQKELEHMAGHTGESAEALRARLTKQGALDRMKSKLRSDKTLEWLYRNARIRTQAPAKK